MGAAQWSLFLAVQAKVKALYTLGLDTITPAGLALIDDADAAAQLVTLGALGIATPSYMTGFLYGLTLSNSPGDLTNDIDIAAGSARNSTDINTMVLASALTKRLDAAWAVGTNQGGRMSAAAIADTTYHMHLIKRVDTGVVDVGFDVSATAPTMPTNYTLFRRIGSITRLSAAIRLFRQVGDNFYLETPTRTITATNPGTSAVTRTLRDIPLGLSVTVLLNCGGNGGTNNWFGLISSLASADITPTSSIYNCRPFATDGNGISFVMVETNTSAQVRSRLNASGASDVLTVLENGWIDTRGRT